MKKSKFEAHYRGSLEKNYKKSFKLKSGKEWLIGNFEQFKNDPRGNSALELKYWKLKKNSRHDTKVQSNAIECTIILKGKVRGFIREKKIELKKGEYVVIPPRIINNIVEKVIEDTEGFTIKSPSDPSDTIKLPGYRISKK